MQDVLTYPFTYWVGMNTDPRTSPEALSEFNRFYSTTHVGEVIAAHPGFVDACRYELVDSDAPDAGPRWLAIYGMADEAAAVRYLRDNERPWLHRRKYSPWPPARKRAKTVWRMLWRSSESSGSLSGPAQFASLVGMNEPPSLAAPPADARVTCLELYRPFAPPEPDAPRYCVIHESDNANVSPADADPLWQWLYRRIT